jgi:hypothetical protein
VAEYGDLTKIEQLHREQEVLTQAMTILENDGTISAFTASPVAQAQTSVLTMPVMVMTVDPKQNLMAACHAACVQRYNQINQELRDLGVTGGPPDHGSNVEQRPGD